MILMVHIHYSRAPDIVVPDHLTTDPSVPVTAHRDVFGNWCTRIVAPIGRIRLSANAVVRDTGEPDVVVPGARQHAGERSARRDSGVPAGQPVLRDGSAVRGGLAAVRPDAAGMAARAGDLRLRPQPHRVRLSGCSPHQDRLGSLQGAHGSLPRLRAPGHRILPLHEYSGALLHRLPRRYGDAAALRRRGFRRVV